VWDGQTAFSRTDLIAIDTETTVVDNTREVSRLALMSASDGVETVLVPPHLVNRWLFLHRFETLVGYNIAFDFWVLQRHLDGDKESAERLWKMARYGQIRDAMLLDMLIRLATVRSETLYPRDLRECCLDVLGGECNEKLPDKESPYRKRFGEIIGVDWEEVDPGFFDYAAADTLWTRRLYEELVRRAETVTCRHTGEVLPAATQRWGHLTERIQVWGAIALAEAGRNGLTVDGGKVTETEVRLREAIEGRVQVLSSWCPDMFNTYVAKRYHGAHKVSKLTGIPKMRLSEVRRVLERLEGELGVTAPRTPKSNEVLASAGWWRPFVHQSPFLEHWIGLVDDTKLLQFEVKLKGQGSIHPSYRELVRTGRCSSHDPNMQNWPREPWFREQFMARPGHSLIIADYSAVELRTLAAVLFRRYGTSALADVLRKGIDPHCYTAAMVRKENYDVFLTRKLTNPAGYRADRQAAKAINFGVPGGLGAARLVGYAKQQYGVELSLDSARSFRSFLIEEVYPELSLYLADLSVTSLASALGVTEAQVLKVVGDQWKVGTIERVVKGVGRKKDGGPLPRYAVDMSWQNLEELFDLGTVQDVCLRDLIWSRGAGPELHGRLFPGKVTTLTGRVRCGVDYGEGHNTPFQGLAADGAKVALWRLTTHGFRVAAFIHDEIVVEISDDQLTRGVKAVAVIMRGAMSSVMGECGVPVEVEVVTGKTWVKG
jgi:hypothetical protein